MNLGKWIGGIIGFMALGPLGALAGIVLGSLFDNISDLSDQTFGKEGQGNGPYGQAGGFDTGRRPYNPYEGQRDSFLFSLLVMASYIIKADGRVMHSEMEFVRQFLRNNFGEIAVQQGETILLRLFDERKRMEMSDPNAFRRTIYDCGRQIAANLSYEERLQMLAFLAQIAKADGHVCPEEIDALKEVAQAMGMTAAEVESLLNLKSDSLEDAYKVLEIDPSATDDEVRAAYRRMALKHHPDKVASLGEDILKAANEKFQRINEAKERIFKARGMK